jgi:hypothetical protein
MRGWFVYPPLGGASRTGAPSAAPDGGAVAGACEASWPTALPKAARVWPRILVINPELAMNVRRPSTRHPLTRTKVIDGGILVPVDPGRYRRTTSGGGAEALIGRVGIRSLDGGLGRTCAARRSRIGMIARYCRLT